VRLRVILPSPPRPALVLAAALCLAPAALLAQRAVGPVRLALFAGSRLSHPSVGLAGLSGELELERIWSLQAAAQYLDVGAGSYARYELDGRWHPAQGGWIRPYLGAGVALARTSEAALGGPSRDHVGGVGFAGVDVPVFHSTLFAEAVGVETGSLTWELRGGFRLLVLGQ